jgi:hypothetical protein
MTLPKLSRFLLLAVLLSGCASPAKSPGIGSFGTRAGYTGIHLAGDVVHALTFFDLKLSLFSYGIPAGPLWGPMIEINGKPVTTGTTK